MLRYQRKNTITSRISFHQNPAVLPQQALTAEACAGTCLKTTYMKVIEVFKEEMNKSLNAGQHLDKVSKYLKEIQEKQLKGIL